jgi:hypothetical protein
VISLPEAAPGVLAVGWATVELDRAAAQLAHLLAPGAAFADAPSSVVLGARCRIGPATARAGLRIVLLEPETEGRLAATLARSDEGWVVTWAATPARGIPGLGATGSGPLGNERLLGGSFTGPHRLFVEAVPSPS